MSLIDRKSEYVVQPVYTTGVSVGWIVGTIVGLGGSGTVAVCVGAGGVGVLVGSVGDMDLQAKIEAHNRITTRIRKQVFFIGTPLSRSPL